MPYYVGETREFTGPVANQAGNPIVSWSWDFGDGSIGEGQIVTHVYDILGTYTIHLRTINSCGEESDPEDPRCAQTITIEEKLQLFECIFLRLYTGKPFPRVAQQNPIPRISCFQNLYI